MPKIQFSNGQIIEFKDMPSMEDIDSAARALNLQPLSPETQNQPERDFLTKASNVVSSIFPGKKIGEAIGTQIAKARATPEEKQFISPAPSAMEIAGDALQIGAFFLPVGKMAKGLAAGGKALGLGRAAQTAGNIAAGGLAGYTFDVGLGLAEGEEKPFTPGLGTAIGAGIPGAGAVARGGARLAGEVAGKTTGAGFGAIKQGLEATTAGGAKGKAFTSALRGGTTPESIVEEAKRGLQTIKQTRTQEYVKQLEVISKNKTSLDISPVVEEVGNQLEKFGVEVTEQGLDFSRSPLRFNKAAQDDITTIVNEMNGFGLKEGDRTAIGIDSLKRAFDDLYTPSGEARAFVTSVRGQARKVLSQVDGYDELAKNYAEKTDLINDVQRGLSLGDKTSVETAFKKLTSSLRLNNEFRQQFIQELDQATGGELLSKIAGQQLSELMPRGLQGVLAGTGGVIGVSTGVGVVPLLSAALTTSPRIVGEIVSALGFTGNKLNKVVQLIEKNAGKLQFPGDAILDKAKATPNKKGGFLKIPQLNEALDAKTITKTNSIKNSISPKPTTIKPKSQGLKGQGENPTTKASSAKEAIAKGLTEEQYVKEQGTPLYHGSDQPITEFKSARQLRKELGDDFSPSNVGGNSDFVFFTDKESAKGFANARSFNVEGGKRNPTITEGFVSGKILDLNKFPLDVTPEEAGLFTKLANELEQASTMFVDGKSRTSGIGGADGRIIGELRITARRAGSGEPRRISINFNDLDQSRTFASVLEKNNIGGFKFGDRTTVGGFVDAVAVIPSKIKTTPQLRTEYQKALKANKK